ncbi:MAG TPA: lmo0937 family membrane protein [Candidatus Kapabacteria bacterium]|nr:lmo0937 family membrane protein [Candidatus Kapabacteria bacterium]
MLWAILILLIIAWLLGFTIWNIGTIIHVLFIIAIIVVLVRIIQGRRVL